MKTKKLVSSILLIILLISQLCIIPFNSFVHAEEGTTTETKFRFHYEQLQSNSAKDKKSETAVKIYDAIYEMYKSGKLKTGTASYDLVENGNITDEEIQNYLKGDKSLTDGMNAARYAFYADYPEAFYIDFSHLTLRVTRGTDSYHAVIGSGRYENYYVQGFTDETSVDKAVKEFDDRVIEIAEEANKKATTKEKITYVHDTIINSVCYRYENECYKGNEGFLGTPYGALVKRQAVCEGYARAFKTVMDVLDIPCILVQGVHQYSGEVGVDHMWNYIKIEDEVARTSLEKWYAVDCTQDDPTMIVSQEEERQNYQKFVDKVADGANYGKEGLENAKYLLAGEVTMRQRHFENSVVAAAGDYEFTYPALEEENMDAVVVENTDGFKITTQDYKRNDGADSDVEEEVKALQVTLSYRGMSVEKAHDQGLYVLAKWLDSEEGDENAKWVYMIPGGMAFGNSEDGKSSTFVTGPSKYLQFAVTDKKYPDTSSDINALIYKGDDRELIAKSERVYNPHYDYKPAPYISKQSPAQTGTLRIRKTPYKVTATWTEQLVVKPGETPTARITCHSALGSNTSGAQNSKIENLVFDETTNTVTFDFTFSEMWADDTINYNIYIDGLQGEKSQRNPNPIVLSGQNYKECISKQAAKGVWNLYAKPTLIENKDLSVKDWETSNGVKVDEILRNRIALVTTETTKKQEDQMKEQLENNFPNDEVISSSTYNITLTVCKEQIKDIKSGHKVTLKVGFPEGYGPDKVGVTYKAYHFTRDEHGEIISVEELDCVVTQYGLLITCNAFSPFTIAAVKDDGTNKTTKKPLIATAEDCGKVSVKDSQGKKIAGNLAMLDKGETVTIEVTPDAGYQVETLTVCGEVVDVNNVRNASGDTKQVTVDYDQIKDGNSIVNATFVAKTVAQAEQSNNQTVVTADPDGATIEMPSSTMVGLNKTLKIEATTSNTIGIQTYQWYKDGEKLEGKVNKTLEIEHIRKTDAGTYRLEVTTTVDTVSTKTSKECTVTVSSIAVTMNKTENKTLYPGEKQEIIVNIKDFENIGDRLVTIGGTLEFDDNVLELETITGLNDWDIKGAYDKTSKKFVIDTSDTTPIEEDVLKLVFKVKENVAVTSDTIVKIKDITASGGVKDIGAETAETSISIQKRADGITSTKYKVEEGCISRVTPGTTIKTFKENVHSYQTLVFKNKKGETITDENTVLTTDTIIKAGDLEFKLSVIGDIDGNYNSELGELITLTDLAQLKLHYIESDQIALSKASIKAADINGDGKITITDLAQLKLVLIGEMEIGK
ncbi:MAG: hypothetical protein HFJ52_02710 [Clostridia bacterium]|nr:hypothetical protein [Clostridia bacterium]